jgi:hypothetical protein
MSALDKAKAEIRAERLRVRQALTMVFGSPVAMAVAAVFAIAFGTQLLYARERLPPLGGLSLAQVGLPPLDFGRVGELAKEASEAAIRQGAGQQAQGFLTEHAWLVPYLNIAGFVFFALFLAWTFRIQARLYRQKANPGLAHTAGR